MTQIPRMISLGDQPLAVLLADLIEAALVTRVTTDPDAIDLRSRAELFDAPRFERDKKHQASILAFDEYTLAPIALTRREIAGQTRNVIALKISRYSAYRAAREQFALISEQQRIDLLTRGGIGTPPEFSHTFGINCTLETSDGKLLLTRRSNATDSHAGKLSVSVSENSNRDDLDNDALDADKAAKRGFEEELGLTPDEISLEFHSVIAQVPDGQISLLGHATTSLTTSEVIERHASARDAHEASAFHVCSFALDEVSDLLSNHPDWTSWAPATILGSVALRFGSAAAAKIERQVTTTNA